MSTPMFSFFGWVAAGVRHSIPPRPCWRSSCDPFSGWFSSISIIHPRPLCDEFQRRIYLVFAAARDAVAPRTARHR